MPTPTSASTPVPTGETPRDSLSSSFLAGLGDRFRVEREIGRGGMATVWLAHRHGDDGPVALKVLRPAFADAIPAQRFLREIRIAAEVKSPALVPLLESGEIGGVPYYVMPFAEGGSLRELLRKERQLSIHEALRITRAIATALSALHRQGFVHRDIKPENILFSDDGQALVADYGIAHAVSAVERDGFTSTGVVIGTPLYMSPEQSGGGPIDGRSDIYSLGCLLYEMLAGETPFHGATPQAIFARHVLEQPPSLHIVRASISPSLEGVVMRMLAKVEADRFATADDLLETLDTLGTDRDVPGATRVWSATRARRRLHRVLPLVVIALLVSGGVLYKVYSRPLPLNSDRVIVFPFAAVGSAPEPDWAQLPMLVGSALERTASTKWLDGYALLDDAERTRIAGPSAKRLRSLARRENARYFLDGSISRSGEQLSVQVRLHDASSGLMIDSKTESDRHRSAGELALRAVTRVLPTLTGLNAIVDVSGLVGHDPAAVDDWLRGEREYRQSHMAPALQYLEKAVAADSSLSPAAYRAAVAASWMSRPDRARIYIRLALRHADALTTRQRSFAQALERFLEGRADESMQRLWPLLERESESADSWMLAGEILLHLLPTVSADSHARRAVPPPTSWPTEFFAQQAFERARALDPGFSPPLAHLAEMSARQGNVAGLTRNVALLGLTDADSVLTMRTTVMERCLRGGPRDVDWPAVYRRRPATLYHVGFSLWAATTPRARACARSAFQASLSADSAQGPEDWGSLLALHGMLVAQGEAQRAIQLVDSAITAGLGQAVGLYVVDAAAGIEIGNRADAFVAQLFKNIDSRGAPALWLLTLWSARADDAARLDQLHALLAGRSASSGQRLDSLITGVAAAYLALARGDSAGAVRAFGALRPTAELHELESSLWESLATERIVYARLLLSRGDAAEAHRIASTFDNPGVLVHALFLRSSLEIRLRASLALGDTVLERHARERIAFLRASPP